MLTATVVVAGSLLAAYAIRIDHWFVMTDELLYVKLATAIGETLSPVPTVHGEPVAILNQLYPLLLAPLFGALEVPEAFRAGHVLNAFVMASAAVPAYLLARAVVPRLWAHAVAALAVAVPWMVLTGLLMTEAAAYPAFLWGMLALQRCLVVASVSRDLLALAGIGLAVLGRAQFLVLAIVLPLALVVHEARVRGLRHALREVVARHLVLAGAYAAGALAVIVAAAAGVLDRALGSYAVTAEGTLFPDGVWMSTLVHLDVVGVGLGVAPLLLGVAWLLERLVRPTSGAASAFAALAVIATAALALQTASYDLRFGGPGVVRDRYIFYVAPLLLIAAAAALRERPRAVTVVAVSAIFAWSVRDHDFPTFPGLSVDRPASVVNDAIQEQAAGLAPGTFVALAALLLGLALAVAPRIVPRPALAAALGVGVASFSVAATAAGVTRVIRSDPSTDRGLGHAQAVPNWVDSVLPAGAKAAIAPFPVSPAWDLSALLWWDVEFWNRTVERVYVGPSRHFSYSMPPSKVLAIDFETGRVPGTEAAPRYVVVSASDPRFRLAGPRHAANYGLDVIAADLPYRATWATRGLALDGWTRPSRAATIRVYAPPAARDELVRVSLRVSAPPGRATYSLRTAGSQLAGELPPGETRLEQVLVCVPAGGHGDVRVASSAAASIPGPPLGPEPEGMRVVGVGLGPIDVVRTGRGC